MHVTVARVDEFEQALLLRSVLEADGLEVFLPDEFTMQNSPHLLFANEGIRVQVLEADEARARAILDSTVVVGSQPGSPEVVDLAEKLSLINELWKPAIVAELNGQHVKLVKIRGEFVWHSHDNEDEMFLVIDGSFRMEFRERSVELTKGQFIVIPRGVEHRPVADSEAAILLFEPASTVNTGTAGGDRTVGNPERI